MVKKKKKKSVKRESPVSRGLMGKYAPTHLLRNFWGAKSILSRGRFEAVLLEAGDRQACEMRLEVAQQTSRNPEKDSLEDEF